MSTSTLTASASPPGACPAARHDLLVSDEVLHGARTVRLVRDPLRDKTFELGPREHFVLAQLDGHRSPAQISEAYHAEFGRPLDAQAWHTLLRLYGTRSLLEGAPPPKRGRPRFDRVRGNLLAGEVSCVRRPDRLVARLVRLTRPLLHGVGLALTLLLSLVVVALAVLDGTALFDRAAQGFPSWRVISSTVILLWISTALHELGHAVVAHHHGGRVSDLGVKWRLPALMPFCRVSDYQFLPGRRARIATALAGVVANLLFLVPVAALWVAGTRDGTLGQVVATVLLAGTVVAVANLIPLAPLDGYTVLTHTLGVVQLTAASQAYLATLAPARLRSGADTDAGPYPARARRIYLAYGVLAPITVLALAAGAVAITAWSIPPEAGPWRYAAPLLVALLAITGMATAARTRSS